MILTQRLLKIAQMVGCRNVADIGTDHAKLPVYLIERDMCDSVIASDVASGPVQACKNTVSQCGLSNKIQIRQGDGLKTLEIGEVDTVVIAGMGGDLISTILENDSKIAKIAKEIILQPMTHIPQLRCYLKNNNYRVIDEVLVKEKNKIYTIIKVADGKSQYQSDFDFLISPIFVQNKDKLLGEYVLKLLKKYKNEITGLSQANFVDEKQLKNNRYIVCELEKLYEVTKNY